MEVLEQIRQGSKVNVSRGPTLIAALWHGSHSYIHPLKVIPENKWGFCPPPLVS